MGHVRLSDRTKKKLPLVQKELIRNVPEFDGMVLSADFLVNRTINFYLKDSPYEDELEDTNNNEVDK